LRTVIRGEKRYIGMSVHKRKEEKFEIDTAKYQVVSRSGNNIETGSCEIDNDAKEVYFLLDTTNNEYKDINAVFAYFSVEISGLPKVIKGVVYIEIK